MLKSALKAWYNLFPSNREWQPHFDKMTRWNGERWEYRLMTAEEAHEALWWQAIK